MRATTAHKQSVAYRTFQIINYTIMTIVAMLCIYPFIHLLSVSVSNANEVLSGRVNLLPKGFNLDSYKLVLQHPNFLTGYRSTVLYTCVGTLIAMFMTVTCAYPLSKKYLPGRNAFMKFIVFTMFFFGGLIPNFLLIRSLGFIDHIWAIVIPGSINTYNMILMLTYFKGIPDSLEEAAGIDGMNHLGILTKIYLPLSKPVLATIALFYSVGYWNDWFSAMIYINSLEKQPIMLFLRNIMMGAELAARDGSIKDDRSIANISATFKATTIMLSTLPILVVYPFVQKYFVKGVMIGALKG